MEIKKKRATSPQNGGKEPGRTLKLNLLKETKKDKDVREAPALKISGPEGEIVAGFLLKKSTKTNGWSRRWFVLNEKTGKLGYTKKQEDRYFRGVINLEESNIQEIEEEASQSKSSKSSKGEEKAPSLVFKITSKVSYKTLLKGLTLSGPTAHSTVVLKAETAAEKAEWLNKLKSITDDKEDQVVTKEDCPSIRQSQPDASLDTAPRKPADPEEELRWMVQEVRGYCEAVLNSLAANVPKAVVLCQVEKAKEEMLNKLYISVSSQSTLMIEELLQEDSNVKRKREKVQRQYSLLSQLARQLGHHDNQTVAPSTMSNGCLADNLRINGDSTGDDWRSAFDSAANGLLRLDSRSGSGGHSRRYSEPPQNGDAVLDSGSKSPHRPNQMQSAPHGFGHAF